MRARRKQGVVTGGPEVGVQTGAAKRAAHSARMHAEYARPAERASSGPAGALGAAELNNECVAAAPSRSCTGFRHNCRARGAAHSTGPGGCSHWRHSPGPVASRACSGGSARRAVCRRRRRAIPCLGCLAVAQLVQIDAPPAASACRGGQQTVRARPGCTASTVAAAMTRGRQRRARHCVCQLQQHAARPARSSKAVHGRPLMRLSARSNGGGVTSQGAAAAAPR